MVTTTHSIHCGGTSGSHELPAATAEGKHCILVWLGQPMQAQLVLCTTMIIQRVCDHAQLCDDG